MRLQGGSGSGAGDARLPGCERENGRSQAPAAERPPDIHIPGEDRLTHEAGWIPSYFTSIIFFTSTAFPVRMVIQ